MEYTYDIEIGVFSIRPNPYGTWDLYIDDIFLANYAEPDVAAEDVAQCVTGFWEWDRQRTMPKAGDLNAWIAHPAV